MFAEGLHRWLPLCKQTPELICKSAHKYARSPGQEIIYYFSFKKGIDNKDPLCYTIIVPRECIVPRKVG